MLLNKKFAHKKNKFLEYLRKNGIETRPILSGNFMNQQSIKLYGFNNQKRIFKNSQIIEDLGFFIGLHTAPINSDILKKLTHHLLMISNI
jgi:CDP-6-deoxy-D-xylo-4-hexulose-3-dehydrase